MARSLITSTDEDLQSDSGGVLFSIVQGEQLEFPVTINFIQNVSLYYTFECVIMEGNNMYDSPEKPSIAKPGGIANTLTVFVPPWRGVYVADALYSRDDLVSHDSIIYIAMSGYLTLQSIPGTDTSWTVYMPNVVYVRFDKSLSTTWSVQPTAGANVYGFIELSVKEPFGSRFERVWKPLRGMISFAYSPTQLN